MGVLVVVQYVATLLWNKVTDSRVGPLTDGRGNGRRGFRRSHCGPPFSLVIALPVLVYIRIAAMKLNR
ncbi:MAG: hypothetical protein LVQ63_06855, partial [Thermoplasmatales archaeon]|nr:hypothetical protein [Thermoplasmatales archaeon]